MPQYKRTQYGLKQYGTFIPLDEPERSSRYRFIRARFGVRRKNGIFWLYQHEAVTFNGRARKLRLTSNTGERIQEEHITLQGEYQKIRLRPNTGDTLYSENYRNR